MRIKTIFIIAVGKNGGVCLSICSKQVYDLVIAETTVGLL